MLSDTLTLTVNANTICKIRSVGMSITNSTSQYALNSTSHRIYDSRISINGFNIFTSLQLVPPSSASAFPGNYSVGKIQTKGFSGISKIDMLLKQGSYDVVCDFSSFPNFDDIQYRLELIYYSYEN